MCTHGHKDDQTAETSLRDAGWDASCLLCVSGAGGSRWIALARPKVDRIVCPWLIWRFTDREVSFDGVPTAGADVGRARPGSAFDIPGVPISLEGKCRSIDTLSGAFDLSPPALDPLAHKVRGASLRRA